ETQRAAEFDGVIAVQTDLPIRLERLSKYRNMPHAEAQARISAQATDQQRADIARRVITNSGSRDDTQAQVQKVWDELRAEV
ncbi:MAG: dephospho-CoA kinase, partial [Rothia dentocariosa]